jgi:uncharacterized membrane protein
MDKSNGEKATERIENITFLQLLQLIVLFALGIAIMSVILQASWNVSVSKLFNMPEIDIIQSVGLLFVSSILFKR